MEPRARAAGALRTTRIRLAATCALLVGLVFVQDPGLLVPDTKLDLVLDPARFLSRALQLWDPSSAFGQLQNQAYGYLWPMGPFFWLGDLLGAPGWVVQRAWWALLLCTAFLGAALLLRALGVRRDLAVVVAALAYALSPRLLTVLGPISIEGWPSALAPWVLLPLVVGAERGSPRRAAALSALAVAMVGGVNAAATFAVLPLGVVWLLTRERGPRRRTMMLWWPAFTLLGTLWWLVPLFTLGAYSPPFLDFIETATVTTFPTTVFDALRGTSNWVPYVEAGSRAGNALITQGHLAVMSAVVLALGLLGLAHRRTPHRWFLSLSLVVGLVMVTAGHQGAVQGLLAGSLSDALDGALAPLRNVHKFDPIVRLPLVVGLAWTLQRLVEARPRRHARVDRAVALGVSLLCVALAASPALTSRLAPAGAFLAVPDYWRDAATWLEGAQGEQPGTALLVPGSGFGEYAWGSPRDEPMQSLAGTPWAVRNQVPLVPAGNVRMLDRVEQAFAQGDGSAGLTSLLQRSGVRWLVVRNDLVRDDDVPHPTLVRQALDGSPGLTPVRTFGPEVGGRAHLLEDGVRLLVAGGWQQRLRAVEVWRVPQAPVSESASPAVVAGGPEDLLDLDDLGVLDGGPTVLAADVPTGEAGAALADAPLVLTDGLRTRERAFARVHDGYSPVLTPGVARRTTNPVADYLEPRHESWQTQARLLGARAVTASSSASDAIALGGADRGRLPLAALDGDPTTDWVADRGSAEADRWRVDVDVAREPGTVRLLGGRDAGDRQQVQVVTSGGASDVVDLGPGQEAEVEVTGRTSWLEVRAVEETREPTSLAEVEVAGLAPVMRLDLPVLPESWGTPDTVLLRADRDARTGCAEVDGTVRCTASRARGDEEATLTARRFVLSQQATYEAQLWVRPRPGTGLDDLLASAQPVNVRATSSGVGDPRGGALAALDGDLGSAWGASDLDLTPSLTLSWLREQRVGTVSVQVDPDSPVARPTTVEVRAGSEVREVELDARGTGSFAPLRARVVEVRVLESAPALDLETGEQLAPGIGELRLGGAASLPLTASTQVVDRGCGSGPRVTVQQDSYATAVTASDAQVVAGERLPARLCGAGGTGPPLTLAPGAADVLVRPSSAFELEALVLARPSGPGEAEVLATRHNANAGWAGEQDGAPLAPLVVDGWRQGFLAGAGAEDGPLRTSFLPETPYRLGLGAGLVGWLVLTAGVALTGRRQGRHDRSTPPAAGPAEPRPAWVVLTTLGAGALLAGVPGAVLAGLVLLGCVALRRGRDVAGVVAPGLVVVASLAYLARPWGDAAGWAGEWAWPAYLSLVPVLLAVGLTLRDAPAAGRRSVRSRARIAGRSTTR